MTWSKPDFVEITLNMEVTAYVYTDDATDALTLATLRRNAERFAETPRAQVDERAGE